MSTTPELHLPPAGTDWVPNNDFAPNLGAASLTAGPGGVIDGIEFQAYLLSTPDVIAYQFLSDLLDEGTNGEAVDPATTWGLRARWVASGVPVSGWSAQQVLVTPP